MRIRVNKLIELTEKDEKDFIKVFDEGSYENELVKWLFTTYRTGLKRSILLKMVKLSENYGQLDFLKDELMSIFEEREVKEYIIELLMISYYKKPINAVYMNDLYTFKPIIPKDISELNFSLFASYSKCFGKLCFTEKHFENALFKVYQTFEKKEIPVKSFEDLCALSAVFAYLYNNKFKKKDLVKIFGTNTKDFNYYLALLLKENDDEKDNWFW